MSDLDLSKLPQPLRIQSEQAKRPRTGWTWLRDIGMTGLLIGVISTAAATLVSAYFQYKRWQVEQQMARHAANSAAASSTFTTISSELARMYAQQEILFFLYREALDKPAPEEAAFLAARARAIFNQYEKGRVALRSNMDSYRFEARRNLDWTSDPETPALVVDQGVDHDPLSRAKLKQSGFSCLAPLSLPQTDDNQHFTPSPIGDFKVDWNSSVHHLIVFDYCFRDIHDLIKPARIWAGTLTAETLKTAEPGRMSPDALKAVEDRLSNQLQRLNAFSALAMTQVERARAINTPPHFPAFVLPALP